MPSTTVRRPSSTARRTAPRSTVRRVGAGVLGLALAATAACGTKGSAGGSGALAVTSSDKACELSTTSLTTGNQTISVTNKGSIVTEAYLYAPDGRSLGEIENVGPGLSRSFSVDIKDAGAYQVQCRPGMTGDGIRTAVTVTAPVGAAPAVTSAQDSAAVAAYRTFVQTESDQLVSTTTAFAAAVKTGDVAASKKAYAEARTHYERIEPVAESFGDLDPKIDERVGDVTDGAAWTGFHEVEKALWVDGTTKDQGPVVDQLVTDVTSLDAEIRKLDFSVADIGNGAKGLLDEVATSKISGEEEAYSHIDLLDFRANLDGVEKAVDVLTPILGTKNPDLLATLKTRFAAVDDALKGYVSAGEPSGYVDYSTVSEAQRKQLSVLVDALTEPVGQITAAATS